MKQSKINWCDSQILTPNFRNGNVFYVIYGEQIVAIRLDKSYIDMDSNFYQFNLKGVATSANNNAVLNGDVMFFINSDKNNQIRVGFKKDNGLYNWTPVYNSVEDAKNGIVSRNVIDIVNLPIYTKGFTGGYLDHGSYNDVQILTWRSYDNQPSESKICYSTMLFYNDGLVFSRKTEPEMIVGYETREEAYNAIKARVSKYKVCAFEDEKKETPKERTISITIKSNMTALDILGMIDKLIAN